MSFPHSFSIENNLAQDHRLESFRWSLAEPEKNPNTPRKKAWGNYKQLKITKAEIPLSYSLTITREDSVLHRSMMKMSLLQRQTGCYFPTGSHYRIWKCFHRKCHDLKGYSRQQFYFSSASMAWQVFGIVPSKSWAYWGKPAALSQSQASLASASAKRISHCSLTVLTRVSAYTVYASSL